MDDQTKNSIKKLVCLNLINIFKSNIVFCGSLCEHVYASYPLEKVKDIDLLIDYNNRYLFFDKLFYHPFLIPGKQNLSIRLCNTHSGVRNFNKHITTYKNFNFFTHRYSCHLHIFGILLDINFYSDVDKYKPTYWNKPLMLPNITKNNQHVLIEDKIHIESKDARLNKIKYFANDHNIHEKSRQKHLDKIEWYQNHKENLNLFNDTKTYQLPNNFDIKKYQYINEDLQPLHIDGALDHFLAHGIQENRKF
jgi:hypothetical protein